MPCPHCDQIGTLNLHSRLLGNDPAAAHEQCVRGQRVFCSNRGERPGCGKTFSMFLASVLPRHTFTAPLLWKLLLQWLAGDSIRASQQKVRLPFGLDTVYAILRRLRHRLDALRCSLCSLLDPPASVDTDPLRQTLQHLQKAFPDTLCCIQEFQLHFKLPFLG